MFTGLLKQFLRKTAAMTIFSSILLVIGFTEVQAAAPGPLICSISPADGVATAGVAFTFSGSTNGGRGSKSYNWDFSDGNGQPITSTGTTVDVTYATAGGPFLVSLDVTDKQGALANCTTTVTVNGAGSNTPPVANDDNYDVTINITRSVTAPGVLANDTDADGDLLTVVLDADVSNGSLTLNADGSFDYTPNINFTGNDSFSYFADDGTALSATAAIVAIKVADTPPPLPVGFLAQTDFKIMMNYELGMHCTGFEFAYCCVLPAYNSILAQVVKPNTVDPKHGGDFPMLIGGDPREG
ncbi:MAG: Ig-like domain-containing protein, partial [Gammaproteobacteria bacterium]